MRRVGHLILVLLVAALAAPGCGPAMATVSGTVTVDGAPLKDGVISYVPANGEGEPVTTTVQNGQYQLQVIAGQKLVQISAPVVIGTRRESDGPNALTVDITEESLPDRYHVQTELTFDVQPGQNTKDWSLESKKAKR